MDYRNERRWMYNRVNPGRKGLTDEFKAGVDNFVDFACVQPTFAENNVIKCPCTKCRNRRYKNPGDVKLHLYKWGFESNYWCWIYHGEEVLQSSGNFDDTSHNHVDGDDMYETMIYDNFGLNQEPSYLNRDIEGPHDSAKQFYELLDSAQQPLWSGCTADTELSFTLKMMSIKSSYNIAQKAMDEIFDACNRAMPSPNKVPSSFYEAEKLVSKLGLGHEKIDCCVNGCMLYYKEDIALAQCKFCFEPRFKKSNKPNSKVPRKRMHYLPLIPRLQRLFASPSSAKHMRWHFENQREPGVMCHPSDGEAWKHFDQMYPQFASEPRNVRLGICSDGFSPFGMSAKSYSCWPIIVTVYNLPPSMCMTTPYMFLTSIIPGKHNPKAKIDVYLQPLIDELKCLWETGVVTYDVSLKHNFVLKAALMWTISDFPAYGMLSGWQTAGKLSCPYCMESSKSFWLKNGGKCTWFDCHRQFLPMDHPFRRNKDAFVKGRIEKAYPPHILSGEAVLERVSYIPQITEQQGSKIPGYGSTHNWTKRSIFWELPYWKDNMIRHNLDVMHIEKNVFDNVFHTVMDTKGTKNNKDGVKSRMDLKEHCSRPELELRVDNNGKLLKPKASFTCDNNQQRAVYEWIQNLCTPDGYAGNLTSCVDLEDCKLHGMKSHDCHVFMECLLPVAFSFLPPSHWKAITELSQFFRDLCSANLHVDKVIQLQQNIPIIICKLEKIFPPGFFNCMEHLPVHLPYEALMGGPIQYRWMYPFERFLNYLKRKVKNKARVEGSICEAYLIEEATNFASYYFESHVESWRTKVGRNLDDGGIDVSVQPTLSVFNRPGRGLGATRSRYLNSKEFFAAHQHVLLNCAEVKPYLTSYEDGLRALNPGITSEQIDLAIEDNFAKWFRDYVYNPDNMVHNQFLHDLAMGPLVEVQTWNGYVVNGYKFQTKGYCEGKSTFNCGVSVKGTDCGDREDDFYGIIKEIIEISYPNSPFKKVVLFNCDWFDTSPNRGTRVDAEYGIVEVQCNRRYQKYDPFIFAHNASQVYYAPYPRDGAY
ncbi:unnamed protein product [Cuscuta epithymum]|uniref:Uncharacterized protein n=1 Tax=Cuscuta epithymum TaxID=186058 RepID=A0AAV0EW19_9ASTE|nr:unnamed protein product [Cuscuta epithymum]